MRYAEGEMRVNEEREEKKTQRVTNSTGGSQFHLTKRHTTVRDSYRYGEADNTLHIVSTSLRFISLHSVVLPSRLEFLLVGQRVHGVGIYPFRHPRNNVKINAVRLGHE
jgi:hypothetical protein